MDFLFDIGNVILEVDFHSALRRILPPDADSTAIMELLLARKDELEAGRIDSEDFLAWAATTVATGLSRAEFVAAWLDVFRPIEPMWHTIDALAGAGHRLILFSNTNDLHAANAFARFPVFRRFHGAVYSHLVGAMKPEDTIYQHAISRFGLTPAATFYIDDLAENIATGRRLGFRCWQYDAKHHPPFAAWLARELAATPPPP